MKNKMFKNLVCLFVSLVLGNGLTQAVEFDKFFTDNTLRLDLKMMESGENAGIEVDRMRVLPGWHGRRVNLDKFYVNNDLEVNMMDLKSGEVIYRTSMYHGFNYDMVEGQEDEYVEYESDNVLRLPMPRNGVKLEIVCLTKRRDTIISKCIDLPKKELKKKATHVKKGELDKKRLDMRVLNHSTYPTAVKVAIVSEGFTEQLLPKFDTLAVNLVDSLFCQEGFKKYRDRFEITEVRIPSVDAGVTRLTKNDIKNTPIGAQFGAFGIERLLTIPSMRRVADVLEGVPYDWVIVLANTNDYGGAGCFNNYSIGYVGGWGTQVTIHEFGHHFVALGDEYEDGDFGDDILNKLEPTAPNITTLVDFSGKWQNLIDEGKASLIEGAGYVPKGVWRGCKNCLMRTVQEYKFCPVCNQAIERCVVFMTEEKNN